MKRLRRTFLCMAAAPVLVTCMAWHAGSLMIHPKHHAVNAPPRDLACVNVSFASEPGIEIKGWYVEAPAASRAVLLLHPMGGDRTSMLDYARFLHRAGYACLMIDFRAHGESTGEMRSFGWHEARDAAAGVAWLKQRLPGARVAVIGTSLGGAAALLAKDSLHADAIIAQSVYAHLRDATWNRLDMRLGATIASTSSWLLDGQVPLRMSLNIDDIAPAKAAVFTTCPVFVIHGTEDRNARLWEGRAIYDACPSPLKQWWAVPGAAHVDLCTFAGEDYQRRVLAFFEASLK